MPRLVILAFVLSAVVLGCKALPHETVRRLNDLDPRTARGLLPPNTFHGHSLVHALFPNVTDDCLWALGNLTSNNSTLSKYIDAAGKLPSGFELGNLLWIGSYSLCQTIPSAKYCMVNAGAHLGNTTVAIRWGLCVPDVCSEMDVANTLEDIITDLLFFKNILGVSTNANPRAVYCAKHSEYSGWAIAILFMCAILCLCCLVGTIIDMLENFTILPLIPINKNSTFMPIQNSSAAINGTLPSGVVDQDTGAVSEEDLDTDQLLNSNPESNTSLLPVQLVTCKKSIVTQFFLCFSLIKNTNKIFDTNVTPGAIRSLNGMRVLSISWVILGHTYLWLLTTGVINNPLTSLGIVHRFSFQAINNAFLSVDSFFFLSGLLVAYIGLRHMHEEDGHLPLLKFYVHRFVRLTPSYMFVVWFYATLDPFLGEGPLWYTHQQGNTCHKYWWTNLLYINNFYPNDLIKECLGWSWYLANDMQFYVISPVLLYAAYRFGTKGLLSSVGSLLAASFVVTGVLIGYYRLPVAFAGEIVGGGAQANLGSSADYSNLVYIKPYCRISPYLVGIALGYVFYKDKKHTLFRRFRPDMRILVVLGGWCLAIIFGLSSVYGLYKAFRTHPEPLTMTENVIYGVFSRFTWAVALAWVIYACHTGIGGLVNSILSANFWIPLSRLTYGAYLVHPIVLSAFFSAFQNTVAYTDTLLIFYFLAILVVTYLVSYVLAVAVEFPSMHLEKQFMK